MRPFVRRHPIASFVVLAYALSWANWIPLLLRGARVVPGGSVTHFPGLLGPAVAAFVIVTLTEGSAGVARLLRRMVLVSNPRVRFLRYSLSPLAFLLLALIVAWIADRRLPPLRDFGLYSGLPTISLPLVLALVILFSGYGEEVGWRGFALGPLQQRFGAVKGTLVLALIWAGWHTPAFWFVEGYRSMGVATLFGGFGLGICAGAVVLARVLNQTNGSILAAALWHATYNLTSATAASRGVIGAVTTTCVMVWAGLLLVQEWRRPLAPSRLASRAAAPPGDLSHVR
jgi:membrane protease YdiL (CAAX protease family)